MQDEKQVRVHLLVRTACADSDRIKSQLCTLRAHAAEKGWVVAGETVEDGVGGISLDRQGLGKILALAASPAPPFSILLVVSTDRIARNITVMSAVLRHLEQNGITIQTLEGCLSKAPFGRTPLKMADIGVNHEDLGRERDDHGRVRKPTKGSPMGLARVMAASLSEITRASEVSLLDWATAHARKTSVAPEILEFATGSTAACAGGSSYAKTYLALQGLAIP